MKRLARLSLNALVILAALTAAASLSSAAQSKRPEHVFLIILENKDFATTFGPKSPAPYLAHQLPKQGLLLTNYYAIGHASLDNYIAIVSGQPPNHQTQMDCFRYTAFNGFSGLLDNGVAPGSGCVYPKAVPTLADQLAAAHLTWGGYMEDMGNGVPAGPSVCRHPKLDQIDCTFMARAKDQYTTRHNPFVYFDSLIDGGACEKDDVPLERLTRDLQSVATTPNFVFITPNLCNDAHDPAHHSDSRPHQSLYNATEKACPGIVYPDTSETCANGAPGGLVSADAFLEHWVPIIEASPAFKQDGMLIITFDEAMTSGPEADSSSCCDETPGPDPQAQQPGRDGPGGGRIGAVVIAPKFVRTGEDAHDYNHYSLLKSLEDVFGLHPYLGYAAKPGLAAFGPDVYRHP